MKSLLASLLVFLVISAAFADSTGGLYSITSETLGSGGGRSTSAAYRDDTTTGALGSEDSSSPSYDGASGQSATLRDALGLTAGPLTIPEAAAVQLGLFQLLDDSTLLAASSVGAVWARVGGPFTLSSGGLATTQAVASNQTAQLQVTINSTVIPGTLTIENTLADNFGIYGSDGISDDWQVQYFGQNNPLAAPGLDPDGDGQTNFFEFTAGLLPNSGASRFGVVLEEVPGQPGQRRLAFQPANAGRTFTLLKSTTLAPGSWLPVAGASASGNNGALMLIDPAAGGVRAFYQVRIDLP